MIPKNYDKSDILALLDRLQEYMENKSDIRDNDAPNEEMSFSYEIDIAINYLKKQNNGI